MAGSHKKSAALLMLALGPLLAAPEFLPPNTCALCHSRPGVLTRTLGHHEAWRSSIMSAAARDPYWRARVELESAASPGLQDKCLRCHAAADQYAFRSSGRQMRLGELTDLGKQGVGCTVCHRIEPEALGTVRSFTGGFRISQEAFLFGPHERPFAMPMLHHTGYEPAAGKQILDAALCGSCHTLLVDTGSGGTKFAEQATYLEWRASSYPEQGVTCQSCHVPPVRWNDGKPGSDYIAHRPPGGAFPPTRPRSPVGVHTFIGANTQMLDMLEAMEPGNGFGERSAATRRFLAGALALEGDAAVAGGDVVLRVTIRNRTGHKLPSGVPGRRLWLHVTARDATGRVFFESGAWEPSAGELRHAAEYEPHRQEVKRPLETVIYEAVADDVRGTLTHFFTRSAKYRKDNRLLPRGFRAEVMPEGADRAWIAPAGVEGDIDFMAGSDSVRYRISTTAAKAPFRVSVEACYQSIRPADAATAGKSFATVYQAHRGPVILRSLEVSAGN